MSIAITQTETANGRKAYDFTANRTSYTVIDDANGYFTVFSKRLNCGYDLQIKVMSRTQMAERSKALRNFLKLIEA